MEFPLYVINALDFEILTTSQNFKIFKNQSNFLYLFIFFFFFSFFSYLK